jgi:hypothetical protein
MAMDGEVFRVRRKFKRPVEVRLSRRQLDRSHTPRQIGAKIGNTDS